VIATLRKNGENSRRLRLKRTSERAKGVREPRNRPSPRGTLIVPSLPQVGPTKSGRGGFSKNK